MEDKYAEECILSARKHLFLANNYYSILNYMKERKREFLEVSYYYCYCFILASKGFYLTLDYVDNRVHLEASQALVVVEQLIPRLVQRNNRSSLLWQLELRRNSNQ